MPRFYFDFQDRTLIRDDTGEELPNTEAAMRHASRMATELCEDPRGSDALIIVSDGRQYLAEIALIDYAPAEARSAVMR